MKVVKRDGRIVDYDREKISIAIQKANREVKPKERATKENIKWITDYIEKLDRKRILVEDIQDIIEQKLMEFRKYELAKKYIVYRYTRALVRKQNTTDESILGIIRNESNVMSATGNTKIMMASIQRDYIAGEVSRDLTKRLLVPEKISKAHEDGILFFHNADHFVQPIFNSCLVNIKDMLDNGTVINGKMIESPKSFSVACTVITQIVSALASNEYGELSIDLIHLGKYLRKSEEKFRKELEEDFSTKLDSKIIDEIILKRMRTELENGVQTIQYQMNTLMTTNGRPPVVTLFLHLDENDKYINENAKIIEEILKQRYEGVKNERGEKEVLELPKLCYLLDENNIKDGKYYYLTLLSLKCAKEGKNIYYVSAKKMREYNKGNIYSPVGRHFFSPFKDNDGNYIYDGRFNQGVVTINLVQIAILASGDEKKFWSLLNERLDICYDALMCKHYSLLGTSANISPLHWKYGAVSRLRDGERIDRYLRNGYSTLSLGYIGLNECVKILKNTEMFSKEGKAFAIKVMKKLKSATISWKDKTGIAFDLYGSDSKIIGSYFVNIDREKYGNIENITGKSYYTDSFHIQSKDIDIYERLSIENELQSFSNGGSLIFIDKNNLNEEMLEYIYQNTLYVEIKDND